MGCHARRAWHNVHTTRESRDAARVKPTRAAWIKRHHDSITATVRDLLAHLGIEPYASEDHELPDLGEYLAWLVEDLTVGNIDS